MKKVIIGFVIILVFGIVIFLVGLVHVKENTYAVIQTKLSGLEEKVYGPDIWLWRWEKLLPTVFTMYRFNLNPYHADIDVPLNSNLGTEDITEGEETDTASSEFSFSLVFYLVFDIIPEKLPSLVKSGLTPETLDIWYHDIATGLTEKVTAIIIKDPATLNLKKQEFLARLRTLIAHETVYDAVSLIRLEPKSLRIPDYDEYISLKSWFLSFLDKKIATLQEEKERHIRAIEREMDEIILNLKTYKDVLQKYPAIVDFLYMNREGFTTHTPEYTDEEED
ncbi:MAG: hypothetical protein JW881_09885 [Spirochaetales bacterium]|nr:hypothetical protein [Spirochaetales bacterium]